MIKMVMIIISLFQEIKNYEQLNEVSNLENNIFEINYYQDEINEKNLINSEQIDTNNIQSLKEINPNKYLPKNYFKIPENNIPLINNKQKNIINIIYQKDDYYINYYYSKNYSLIDIGGKQEVKDLFSERKKMNYENKDPLKILEQDFSIESYYKRMQFEYQVYYYYDGILSSDKTYKRTLYYGTEVRTYEEKEVEGFIKDYTTIDDEALTITENVNANIIYVYYRKK